MQRLANQEDRRQAKLIKDAERKEAKHACQLAKQLQEDLKQARKGKTKALKKTLNTQSTVVVNITAVDDRVAAPAQSRRGRQINLPQRFLQ